MVRNIYIKQGNAYIINLDSSSIQIIIMCTSLMCNFRLQHTVNIFEMVLTIQVCHSMLQGCGGTQYFLGVPTHNWTCFYYARLIVSVIGTSHIFANEFVYLCGIGKNKIYFLRKMFPSQVLLNTSEHTAICKDGNSSNIYRHFQTSNLFTTAYLCTNQWM